MKHIENSFGSAMASAAPLTAKYDEQNVIVAAAGGSILGRCTEALIHSVERAPEGTVNADAYAAFVVAASTEPNEVTGYSEFAARVTESATKIAEAVQRELFHARNVVKPVVDELTARMSERCSLLDSDPMSGIEIVRRSIPSVLLHPSLMASFGRAQESVVDITPRNFRLPIYEDNQILPLLRTGAKDLDEGIMDFFSKKGDGWMSTIWKNVFTKFGEASRDGLRSLLYGRGNVDIALFVFLAARNLWQNPVKDVDMTASDYEEAMVHYRDQAAIALCNEVDTLSSEEKNGTLIFSNTRGRLEVWEGPYRDFIAKGGNNEVLLGFSISADDFVSTEQILEKKELYAAAWARHESLNRATYENRRYNAMKSGLVVEFQYMLQTATEEQFPLSLRQPAMAIFEEEVKKLRMDDFSKLALTCMRLICRSRFPATSSEDILEGIQLQIDNNPGISVQEAASIVTIELISRFVAQFMRRISPAQAKGAI